MSALIGSIWIWAALALSGCCLIALPFIRERVGEGRLRSLTRFALGAAVVLVPCLAALLLAPGLSDDIKGLLVAAALATSGWLVTYLQANKEREADNADLMAALRSEIWVQLTDLRRNSHEVTAAEVSSDSAARFFSQPIPPVVFESLASQIFRLPGQVMDDVVQYYSLLASLRQNAVEMRDEVFLGRPTDIRQRAYGVYVTNLGHLATLGEQAIRALNRALEVPDPDRIDLGGDESGVNKPGRARWDPSASALDANGQLP